MTQDTSSGGDTSTAFVVRGVLALTNIITIGVAAVVIILLVLKIQSQHSPHQ